MNKQFGGKGKAAIQHGKTKAVQKHQKSVVKHQGQAMKIRDLKSLQNNNKNTTPTNQSREDKLKSLIEFYNTEDSDDCSPIRTKIKKQGGEINVWINRFLDKYIDDDKKIAWGDKFRTRFYDHYDTLKYIKKKTTGKGCLRENFLIDYLLEKLEDIINKEEPYNHRDILNIGIITHGFFPVKWVSIKKVISGLKKEKIETGQEIIDELKNFLEIEINKLITNAKKVSEIDDIELTIEQLKGLKNLELDFTNIDTDKDKKKTNLKTLSRQKDQEIKQKMKEYEELSLKRKILYFYQLLDDFINRRVK